MNGFRKFYKTICANLAIEQAISLSPVHSTRKLYIYSTNAFERLALLGSHSGGNYGAKETKFLTFRFTFLIGMVHIIVISEYGFGFNRLLYTVMKEYARHHFTLCGCEGLHQFSDTSEIILPGKVDKMRIF